MQKVESVRNTFCKHLRAKNPFGTLEGGENPWFRLDETLTTCWCLKSMSAVGPDDNYVDPGRCKPGRSCYVSPE